MVDRCPLCEQRVSSREIYSSSIMRVVRCAACGLMYQDPQRPETEWGDTYEILPEYQAYSNSSFRSAKQRLFRSRIADLRRRCGLRDSGAFLDIGASYGVMMQCVREELPAWQCFGVETSETARAAARAAGLHVAPSLDDLPSTQLFLWINLDNTLEHVDDPLGFLIRLRGRLAPGGFMYIEVPNESFFSLRYRINDAVRGVEKAPTLPGHLTLFTRSTLRAMLHRAGLRCCIWTASVSEPNRISGVCNQDEAQFRRVLTFLRITKADRLLGFNYFLCAIARAPDGLDGTPAA